MKNFIERNKEFWKDFFIEGSTSKILIEEPSADMIVHANAIFSIVLNQAKFFKPVWLYHETWDIELLKSYVPNAEFVKQTKSTLPLKLKIAIISFCKFIKMYATKEILSFSYDGVRYGDIAYDAYLSRNQVATIKKVNFRMLIIIYSCISRHIQIRRILKSSNYSSVLVSHQVSISSGVMLRTALRHGYKGYLRAGHHQSTLQCFGRLDDVYDYEYKPSPEKVNNIIFKLSDKFDKAFEFVFDRHISGLGSKDALYAFSADNRLYTDRYIFNQRYKLDQAKKNIFIMLHAFNDHPHSHFKWMIFKDYYDWFMETLKFAKRNDAVNWIFKQHPSIKYYRTMDVSFDKIFSNCPSNVIYIDTRQQIDTRSIIHCADLVVTCIGSAGFELPAIGGIPSLTAGDNFYIGLGFTAEPKTKKEYFEVLNNLPKTALLTPEQRKRAKAAYMHIYYFSRVSISACPILSFDDEKDRNLKLWYWGKVNNLYDKHEEKIKREIHEYIRKVSAPDFKRLNRDLSELNEEFLTNYKAVIRK